MRKFDVIFIVVYISVLVLYLFSETGESFRRRAVNKIILASMFSLYSFISFAECGISNNEEIELAGILFSLIGDCCLLWNFTVGGIFFSIGNILFIIFEALLVFTSHTLGNIWWAIIPFFILWGSYFLLEKAGHLQGSHGAIYTKYLVSSTVQGCLGLALAFTLDGTKILLFGIGLCLFMISDYFLGLYHYHRKAMNKKWALRCNSFFYFSGMLLVALSIRFC